MRARWIVLPAVLVLVAGELAAPPGPAAGAEPRADGIGSSGVPLLAVDAGGWGGHTCAVHTDGTLACWGDDNYYGQNTTPAGTFVAVSAGGYHACAIRTDGTLACWGDDSAGQAMPPAGTFTAVSAGGYHACAIRTDGTLACWGGNDAGQATPPSGTFAEVSAGGWHTCAVRSDGSLVCWGDAARGVSTPPAGMFRSVSAARIHNCAVRTDGSLVCWGYDYGAPPSGAFGSVSTGDDHSCAIRTDGTLACWGWNSSGQATPPAGTFTAVTAGNLASCAIASDTTAACWGMEARMPHAVGKLDPLTTWLSTSRVQLSWSARAALAPITSYEIQYRRAPWNGSFGLRTTWQSTAATSAVFIATPGSTYCFSVRAWDGDGYVPPWSAEKCTAVPLDDRSLVRSSSWVAGTGTAYYRHTYLQGKFSGAKLTRSGVRAKQIALLATTCPTCGTVRIYWNSTLLKTVSLSSPTTQHKQLIPLASFSSVRTGTLTIRIVGGGKPVIIDGVAIRRS